MAAQSGGSPLLEEISRVVRRGFRIRALQRNVTVRWRKTSAMADRTGLLVPAGARPCVTARSSRSAGSSVICVCRGSSGDAPGG